MGASTGNYAELSPSERAPNMIYSSNNVQAYRRLIQWDGQAPELNNKNSVEKVVTRVFWSHLSKMVRHIAWEL